jgi:uncharacterized membrane protein
VGVTDLRESTTGDGPGEVRAASWSRRAFVACVLLGVGLGGFVDGIFLHQILQWHHMLTSTGDHPADTVAGLEANTLADGLFHAATWVFVVAGIVVLWRAWAAERPAPTVSAQVGGVLAGWGIFNLVEGLVDHHLLGVHDVRDDVADPLWWNLGFLAFGALLVAVGVALLRRRPRATGRAASHRAG